MSMVDPIDWNLLKLDAFLYYQTHCADNTPGWTKDEEERALNEPAGAEMLTRFHSACSQLSESSKLYFDCQFSRRNWRALLANDQWTLAVSQLMGSYLPLKEVFKLVTVEGEEPRYLIHMWPGYFIPPDQHTRGLGEDDFHTTRRLTDQEIVDLKNYLTDELSKRGVTLDGEVLIERREWSDKQYHLELPLGTCKASSKESTADPA